MTRESGTPSQFDPGGVLKDIHDPATRSVRVVSGNTEVPTDYTKVDLTYNAFNSVTEAVFYKGTAKETTLIETRADSAGSLNNKYFLINSAEDREQFYVWFNVNSAGTDPDVTDKIGIEVALDTNDSAAVVAVSLGTILGRQRQFNVTTNGDRVVVENAESGAVTAASDVDTTFQISAKHSGSTAIVKTIDFASEENVRYVFNDVEKKFEAYHFEPIYKTLIDQAATNITYTGKAVSQSASTADAVWQIQREAVSGDLTTIEYADSGNFTQIWDNRESLFGAVPLTNDYSLEFDGVLSYADFGTPTELEFDKDDPFSICCYLKTNETSNQTIIGYHDALIGTDGWTLRITSSGEIEFRLIGGSTNKIVVRSTNSGFNDKDWHGVCVTYDGSELASGVNMYVDGVLETNNVINDNLTNNIVYAGELVVAARSYALNDMFDGNLDEIGVFSSELSASTAQTVSTTPSDLNTVSEASALQWWTRCGDNDIYPTLYDNSDVGNDIDGMMVNMIADDIVGDAP